ncbi:MAG: class A beta-lactamase-related serine hydrolase [Trueperaceae bacterium]|nr:MAG: class A beta-lactamase-related serine hydrolase [Trueperaceae bacterium]
MSITNRADRPAWTRSPLCVVCAVALALAVATSSGAFAQPDLSPRALEPEELDAATVERAAARFELDTIVYDMLTATGVPGAVVAIALGGEVLVAEAYGTADVAAARTLTLDDPLWLASLTKTLTGIAVLDLAARGEFDLAAPLDTLLPAGSVPPPPAGDDTPLTPWHLLTHTSGFDERLLGTAAFDAGPSPPLASLALPPRVEGAGSGPRYGNAGHHALGLLLETVTGSNAEAALRELVFEPLGLESARLFRPADDAYEAATVPGHAREAGGALRPLTTPTVLDATAGGLRLSGRDAATLLAALTAQEPTGPLGNDVRTALLTPAARAHPEAAGTTLGMAEGWLLGHEVVLQSGDLPGTHSLLLIVPGYALGLFVHVNGPAGETGAWETVDGIRDPRWWLAERIVERFLGDAREAPPAVPASALPADGRVQSGVYRPDRISRTGPEAFLTLTGLAQFPVRVEADGSVVVATPADASPPRRYHPGAAGAYVRAGGGDVLAATHGPDGEPRLHGWLGLPATLERVPPLERLEVLLACLLAAAVAALVALVSWPLGAWFRWRGRGPRSSGPGSSLQVLRWAARVQALAVVAWLVVTFRAVDTAQRSLALDPTWWPAASAALAVVTMAGLTLVMVGALLVLSGARDRRGPPLRPRAAFHVVLGLAGLALVLPSWVWRLPPWS